MVEIYSPRTLHEPPGFNHVAFAGDTIYIAGQVAVTVDGEVVGQGNYYEQTVQVLENIAAALRSAGAGWNDIVRRTIYTLDVSEYPQIRRAMDTVIGEHVPPPQTLLGVTSLARPGLLVEIECTAVKPK